MSQINKILELLNTGEWICTSRMYALYIADPRSRLCQIKKRGYELENRLCQKHNHKGNSKQWRIKPKDTLF